MKGLLKALALVGIIAGILISIKLALEIFAPNMKKYYVIDK